MAKKKWKIRFWKALALAQEITTAMMLWPAVKSKFQTVYDQLEAEFKRVVEENRSDPMVAAFEGSINRIKLILSREWERF